LPAVPITLFAPTHATLRVHRVSTKEKHVRSSLILLLSLWLFAGCRKDVAEATPDCDTKAAYESNPSKVTIADGVWGTISFMEGNCMPVFDPATSTCKNCPVQRTVRFYEYTLRSQATPQGSQQFFDSFSTQLVKEVASDGQGFYQADLPAGKYTVVVLENGKLYSFGADAQGGLSPLTLTGGKQNVNLTLTYRAVF
jgi:hypothetical protein